MPASNNLQSKYHSAAETSIRALDQCGPFSASTTFTFLTAFAGFLHLAVHLTNNLVLGVPYGPYQSASIWATTILFTVIPLVALAISSLLEYLSSRSMV